MKVAVPRSQHSPTLGQLASSQTVCRLSASIDCFSLPVGRAARGGDLEPRRLALAKRPPLDPGRAAGVGARAGDVDALGRVSLMRSQTLVARAPRPPRPRPARGRRPRRGARRARSRTRRRSCSAPSSRVSEVIRQASIPQGTTHSNGCRSLATLTARPWVVIPRRTWIPIEPILRASPAGGGSAPTQTPVSPSISPASTPEVADRGDHRPLHQPDVLVHVVGLRQLAQVDDRIGDQLAGAVVGDPAAAVGLDDLDPLHPVPVLAHRQLGGGRAAALGVDGRVLEHQHQVGDLAASSRARSSARCIRRASS